MENDKNENKALSQTSVMVSADLINKIHNEDCLVTLKRIPDNSIDAVIIDPPYGVLKHKIETELNIDLLFSEYYRILKNDSFICFFGQMPTITNWIVSATNYFKYQDEITWVKRSATAIYLPLIRQKETVLIYKKGNPKYNCTKGPFEDVKIPLLLNGLYDFESIKRYISAKISNKSEIKSSGRLKTNDSAFKDYTNGGNRAPDDVNFTNVWSFMPQNKASFNDDLNNVKHPTVKPILLINRLIALISRENEIVYDGFMGSGTTAISCMQMNRKFVGSELHKEYFDIATKRIENESSKLSLFAVSEH